MQRVTISSGSIIPQQIIFSQLLWISVYGSYIINMWATISAFTFCCHSL